MQKCPKCGHENRVGVLICDKCGTNLITGRVPDIDTRSLEDEPIETSLDETDPTLPARVAAEVRTDRNTDEFLHGGTLWLEVEGSAKSVQLPLTTHSREIILGRRDPATGQLPDVDLTPFAGYRMGVSRRHCVLRYIEGKYLDLFDQGSSNGTYLNGIRVEPHQPNRLHDGDRLRLGQITLRLHFESRSMPSMPTTAPLSGLPVAIQQKPKPLGDKKTDVRGSLQSAVAKLSGDRDASKGDSKDGSEETVNLTADEARAALADDTDKKVAPPASDDAVTTPEQSKSGTSAPVGSATENKLPKVAPSQPKPATVTGDDTDKKVAPPASAESKSDDSSSETNDETSKASDEENPPKSS